MSRKGSEIAAGINLHKIIFCVIAALLISSGAGAQKLDSILKIEPPKPNTYEEFFDTARPDTGVTTISVGSIQSGEGESHIYDSSDRFFNWKEEADEIYYVRTLQRNRSSEAAIAELKKGKDFWYVGEIEAFQSQKEELLKRGDSIAHARALSEDKMLKKRDGFESRPWMRTVLWAIIIGILLFALVYFIAANKLSVFTRKENVQGQHEDQAVVDIFQTEFDEMLAKARADGNYRLMTRILYLQTLRLLSDKNIIRYSPNYTNLTYIDQLRSTDYYPDFFTITRHYEYVWYGKFDLPKEAYDKIETAIRSFQKRIA